jgi:DNA-binding response OmpR family regulator
MITWKTDIRTAHIVLIISDQPENVVSWSTLFSQRNCIILSETKIPDAIQSARLINPSLILIDIELPKEKRASILAELRSICRAPILMLVTANTVDEIVEANHAGADECLVKPVNPAVLVIKAVAWLGHHTGRLRAPIGITL